MATANSKIEICNVALALLGEDSIRAFDEKNKRARMADVFFDFTRDYLLAKFDWPFARRFKKLQPLAVQQLKMEVPAGKFAYELPADCHTPRDIHPPGSKDKWHVMGWQLYCDIDPKSDRDVYLYYTCAALDPRFYSHTFNNLVALGLAVKMCPAITQDKALAGALMEQFAAEQINAWESEANIGEDYRAHDEDPNNDTFVNPDGWIEPNGFLSD